MAINFPATPTLNQTYTFNGRTWTYNGVGWQATGASGLSVYTKTDFTATAAQTTFTVAYTVGFVDVYYNGSKLSITEYTATNGTSVVLGTACAVNDIVETVAWTVSTTLNPALGVATATSLAIGGATIGSNALAVTGTTQLNSALNYGGVTLSNSVTGTGSMVLSSSPTFTGTIIAAGATFSSPVTINDSTEVQLTMGGTNGSQGRLRTQWDGTGAAGRLTLSAKNIAGTLTDVFRINGEGVLSTLLGPLNYGGVTLSNSVTGTGSMVLSTSPQFATSVGIGMTPSNVLDITQNQNSESRISILNSNGGASAAAELQATNGTHAGVLYQFGTGYTTSGILRQDGTVLSSGSSAGGLTLATFSSSPIYFGVGLAEVARFDTSGGLFLGVTTSWSQSRIDSKATGVTNSFNAVSGWNSGSAGAAYTARVDNTAAYLIEFYYGASTSVGKITTNGTATTYNTSSDARLKTNVSDAAPASALIDAIQVRQFDWKVDNSHQRYGMVAQELLEVAPEAVSVPTDPEQMMGVDYSTLVPMLIKEVQSLRTRLAALESK